MPNIKVENLYNTVITEVVGIPATGDCDFTVSTPPENTNGFIIISPANSILREIMYYHNVIGNRIYVRGVNRKNPKAHTVTEPVKMNDVAEIFNYFSDMISQSFYVEKTGGLTVKVWGGYVYYNGSAVSVADTALTLVDNTTNYITYTYATNSIESNITNVGNIKATVIVASGLITSITYKNAKESYIDFTVALTGALPSQSGQIGNSLITNGTNASWQSPFPTQTGNSGKVLFTNGTTTSWGVIPQASTAVAGSVEIATQAEFDAGTDVGGTGATLVAPPSVVNTLNYTSITPYESSISLGDPVGLVYDGLFKCTTENKSSANVSASSVAILGQANLDSTRTFFLYYSGASVYARVGTLSGDVMTYGTEVLLYGATAPFTGGVCTIDTDKVAMCYVDSTAGNTYRHRIAIISGSTITLGTEQIQTEGTGGFTVNVVNICKVRTDCYATIVNVYNGSNFLDRLFISTVSGTVVTLAASIRSITTNGYTLRIAYLSDNLLGIMEYQNGPTLTQMIAINPAGINITTTYTGSAGTTNNSNMLFCRVSNTQYATIYNTAGGSPTVLIILVSKPPSGTANVITTVVDTAQVIVFPIINMGGSNIGIYNTTTSLIQVYGIGGNIIGTISGFSAPTSATLYYYMNMVNGRWVYLNGTNGTSRIVNFARMFYIGIGRNSIGSFQFRGKLSGLTGLVPGYNYYVQADGTIGNTFSSRYIGRGLTTTSLLIG